MDDTKVTNVSIDLFINILEKAVWHEGDIPRSLWIEESMALLFILFLEAPFLGGLGLALALTLLLGYLI